MAFDLGGLFRGNHNTTDVSYQTSAPRDAVRTENAESIGRSETARQYAITKEIMNLTPGQTLSGEIVDINGNEVQIMVGKDAYILAHLEHDVKPSIGQFMSFEVKNNQGNTLSLRPLHTNLAGDANLLKALEAAGLPANDKTAAMVSALMEEGMSIDKKTLLQTFKTMMQNPDVSPLTLVQMNRLKLPITPENITQFEQYKNYEHQIAASVDVIADEIPKEMLLQLQNGELPQTLAFTNQILGMLENAQTNAGEGIMLTQILPDAAGREQLADILAQAGATPEQLAQVKSGEISLQDVLAIVQKYVKDAADAAQGQNVQGHPEEGAPQSDKANPQPDANGTAAGTASTPESIGTAAKQLQNLTDANAFTNIHSKEAIKDTLSALLSDKSFAKILKAEIANQFLLNPEELSQEGKVEEFYTKLREQTIKLTDTLAKAAHAETTLAKTVENVRENIDFMNQLNQTFNYVQLPLKMSGKSAHGELYVYTNKKHLAKKDGNVSALLHLDMEHLGTVDVYVTLLNEKLSTKFYLENDEMLDFIESNLHILNERLQKRGYSVATEAAVREKQTNVMEEIIKQDKNVSLLSTQSFDVRA